MIRVAIQARVIYVRMVVICHIYSKITHISMLRHSLGQPPRTELRFVQGSQYSKAESRNDLETMYGG